MELLELCHTELLIMLLLTVLAMDMETGVEDRSTRGIWSGLIDLLAFMTRNDAIDEEWKCLFTDYVASYAAHVPYRQITYIPTRLTSFTISNIHNILSPFISYHLSLLLFSCSRGTLLTPFFVILLLWSLSFLISRRIPNQCTRYYNITYWIAFWILRGLTLW